MKIFVTGASGFVGGAVVGELVQAGHQVLGLARSDAAAKRVEALSASPHRGDLEDLDSIIAGASRADAVVHTGFVHDFSRFKDCCELDRRVIEALGSALAGSSRPLVVTSAIGVLRGNVDERTRATSPSPNPRVATEEACQALVERGINASVVRLPPSTHGEGDYGFVPLLIKLARERKESAYIGDGLNLWPAIHRADAAQIYRLAVERAKPDAFYHAVAEEGVPFRHIAEVIARRLGVPLVSKAPEAAAAHFTWFTHFAAMNLRASSARTRAELRWQPTMPGLLADLDNPYYFA